MGRLVWVYPVLATFVGSLVADLVALGVNQLVGDVVIGGLPVDLMLCGRAQRGHRRTRRAARAGAGRPLRARRGASLVSRWPT